MFKCSKLALNLKKNNYLLIKTAKKDFDNFSIVKVCVLQYNYNGCFQNLFESTACTSNFKVDVNLLSYLLDVNLLRISNRIQLLIFNFNPHRPYLLQPLIITHFL
jgi:hypothetical protein